MLADCFEFIILTKIPDQDLAVVVDACGVVLDLHYIRAERK